MPDHIGGLADVLALLVQLQAVLSDNNCFHPGHNAVLSIDRPYHLVPCRTLGLSLRTAAEKFETSLPLRKTLSQVVEEFRTPCGDICCQARLIDLMLGLNAVL